MSYCYQLPKRAYIALIIGGIAAAIAASVAVISSTPSSMTRSSSDQNSYMPEIFPVNSNPYGKSYGEWTGQIWQHFQGIPAETNPANDPDGDFCDLEQNDPNVWYIHSTFGGKQVRECTVPSDRAIVMLIGGVSCSYAEDPTLKTEQDLRKCAEDNVGEMRLRASINGNRVGNVEEYYSVSPVFPVTLPAGNVWDVAGPVDTEFVAAGWTLVVSPLPEGEHIIEYSAEEPNFAATGEPVWSTAVEYHLTVVSSG